MAFEQLDESDIQLWIYIGQGDDARTFPNCYSNETYKDNCMK